MLYFFLTEFYFENASLIFLYFTFPFWFSSNISIYCHSWNLIVPSNEERNKNGIGGYEVFWSIKFRQKKKEKKKGLVKSRGKNNVWLLFTAAALHWLIHNIKSYTLLDVLSLFLSKLLVMNYSRSCSQDFVLWLLPSTRSAAGSRGRPKLSRSVRLNFLPFISVTGYSNLSRQHNVFRWHGLEEVPVPHWVCGPRGSQPGRAAGGPHPPPSVGPVRRPHDTQRRSSPARTPSSVRQDSEPAPGRVLLWKQRPLLVAAQKHGLPGHRGLGPGDEQEHGSLRATFWPSDQHGDPRRASLAVRRRVRFRGLQRPPFAGHQWSPGAGPQSVPHQRGQGDALSGVAGGGEQTAGWKLGRDLQVHTWTSVFGGLCGDVPVPPKLSVLHLLLQVPLHDAKARWKAHLHWPQTDHHHISNRWNRGRVGNHNQGTEKWRDPRYPSRAIWNCTEFSSHTKGWDSHTSTCYVLMFPHGIS